MTGFKITKADEALTVTQLLALTSLSQEQLEMKDQLLDWQDKIEACWDVDSFTKLSVEISDIPPGLLKTALRNMFGKALIQCGIKYDKDAEKYVEA